MDIRIYVASVQCFDGSRTAFSYPDIQIAPSIQEARELVIANAQRGFPGLVIDVSIKDLEDSYLIKYLIDKGYDVKRKAI